MTSNMSLWAKPMLVISILLFWLIQSHSVGSSRPPATMCGPRLTRFLKVLCVGSMPNPEQRSKRSFIKSIRGKADVIAENLRNTANWRGNKLAQENQLDLIDKCCFKGCSMAELQSICPLK